MSGMNKVLFSSRKGLNSLHLNNLTPPFVDLRLYSSRAFICLHPWWHVQYISLLLIKTIIHLLKGYFAQEIQELLGWLHINPDFLLLLLKEKIRWLGYHMSVPLDYLDSGPSLFIDN